MRSMLVGVTVVALVCGVAGCSSSDGSTTAATGTTKFAPAITPTSTEPNAVVSPGSGSASSTESAPAPSSQDESAKYAGLLNLVNNGLSGRAVPGKSVRFTQQGKQSANGRFIVDSDKGKTEACMTDSVTGVSLQFVLADEVLNVFSGPRCADKLGSLSEDASGNVQTSSSDATLKALAMKINKLSDGS